MADVLTSDDPQARQHNFVMALNAATPTPYVTFALIALNFGVFFAMVASGVSFFEPTAQQVLPWGANFGPLTASGQWWRLLTACFLHFGIIHIGMNMFILWQVGIFTEKLFGNLRFLAMYLIAGIGGNIAGLFFHPLTVSAGASGAVFGVYGGLLGFLLIERGVVPPASAWRLARSAGFFLIYNVVYGMARPQTDLVAHIGGLATGFAVGGLLARPLSPGREHMHPLRTMWVSVGAVVVGMAAISVLPKGNAAEREFSKMLMTSSMVKVAGSDTVFYSGTATKALAESLGAALVKVGYLGKPGAAAVLRKDSIGTTVFLPLRENLPSHSTKDDITTKFVNGKTVIVQKDESDEKPPREPWDDPEFLASMKRIGPQLASAVGVAPLTIKLISGKGDVKRAIQIDTTAEIIGRVDSVSYSGTATAQDAHSLGTALMECLFFTDRGVTVYLKKGGKATVVSFVLVDGAWNNPRTVAYFQGIGRKVAPSVGGLPLKVDLIDTQHRVQKEVTMQ